MGCIRVADDTHIIIRTHRVCRHLHIAEVYVAQGFYMGFVPANHYVTIMDAQVRFIDLIDSLPMRASVQGQEE